MVDIQRFEITGAGDLATVLDVLTDTVGLEVETDDDGSRRWLDSADGALAAVDGRLEHRVLADGRSVLVWSIDGRVQARVEDVPRDLVNSDDEMLPVRVRTTLGGRPLVASEPVRSRVIVLARRDDDAKTVARAIVDRTESFEGRSLPPLLEIVGLRGYESEAGALLDDIRSRIALASTERSAAERVLGVAHTRLRPTMTAIEGWRVVLRGLTARMIERFPGVLAGDDPDELHDFRVAVRRIRTVLRDGEHVLESEGRERFRDEFQWIGDITTPARDADVHVLDHPEFVESLPPARRDDLTPLLDLLTVHRAQAHADMVTELRSRRRAQFGAAWAAWLDDDSKWTTSIADRSDRPVSVMAAAAVRDAHRRLVKDGRAVKKSSPPIVLHDLRKDAKRLRYLLECFAPALDAHAVETVVERLRRLQDALGVFQDSEVQAHALHELTANAAREGSSPMLLATGSVIEHLGRRGKKARKEFDKAFEQFDGRRIDRAIDAIGGRGATSSKRGKGRRK